jgi:hypothetical protein
MTINKIGHVQIDLSKMMDSSNWKKFVQKMTFFTKFVVKKYIICFCELIKMK